MTVLVVALERATQSWTNVNDQTYTMGTTTFKTNNFTGLSSYGFCTTNTYTLSSRTEKARMITEQEAVNLGCTNADKSCPIWMYKYLYNSTSYGGTLSESDSSIDQTTGNKNFGYWTMSTDSSSARNAWYIYPHGYLWNYHYIHSTYFGASAVVVINK